MTIHNIIIPKEIHDLAEQLQTVLSALESERAKLTEETTKIITGFDARLKELTDTNTMLQSVYKNLTEELTESIPKIATELDEINKDRLQSIKDCYTTIIKDQSKDTEDAKVKINELINDLYTIDKKRIKRFFLGIFTSVIISSIASIGAASYMMKKFPTRVIINSPENIILQDSDVSLWGTENTKVLKKGK